MRRKCLTLALLVFPAISTVGFAGPTRQDVIDAIPDDIALVVIAPNLEKLSSAISDYGRAIGIDEIAQTTAGQLTEVLLERLDGIDTTGTFVLGCRPESLHETFLLCPLKDADAWRKASGAERPEGRLSDLLRLTQRSGETYALLRGDVLVLADDPDSLLDAKKPKGRFAELLKPSGDMLDKNQLIVAIDVPRWDDSVRDFSSVGEAVFQMWAARAPDAKVSDLGIAMMRWSNAKLRELVAESRALMLGVQFSNDGLRFTSEWSVKPDSGVAKYLANVKKASDSPLRGMPDEPFAFAFGYEWHTPPGTPGLMEDMNKVVIEASKSEDKEKLEATIRRTTEIQKQFSGAAGAITAAPDGGLLGNFVYHAEDGVAAAKAMADLYDSSMSMMNAMSMGITIASERSAQEIADIPVDAFALKFGTQDVAMSRGLKAAYGVAPTVLVSGRKKNVAFVFGPGADVEVRMAKVLMARPDALLSSPRVAAALKQISPDPQLVVLLDLIQFFDTVLKLAERTGGRVPEIKFPSQPMPLLAAGIYLNPNVIRGELTIPAAPVKALQKMMDADAAGDGPRE